jgi:predicted MFS family arabinose efflux permease
VASRLRPLRAPAFRRYFAGTAASNLGNAFTAVALAFAVLEATGSVAAVGLVLAATRLPLLLFLVAGGVVGDRLPRRLVMLTCDGVRAVVQAGAALLLALGRATLWELLVLFAVHGLAQAFFQPASAGLLPQIVRVEERQEANALLELSRGAIGLAGMLAGGVVVAVVGPAAALGIDSLTFAVSAAALAGLAVDGAMPARSGSLARDLRDGWHELTRRRWLWIGVVHISLLNVFALVAFFALGPVVASESLGGAAAWGLIGAGFAAGMLAGSALALRWRPRRPLVAAFGGIVLAAPQLALLAVAAPAALVSVASVLGGAQASFWGAVWMTTVQERVPDPALSRVTAYSSIGTLALAPLGLAVVGPLAQAFGTGPVLWAGALWIAVSCPIVAFLPAMRAVTRVAAEPALAV